MLTVYQRAGAVLQPVVPCIGGSCPAQAVWLDLIAPTPEEMAEAARLAGIVLPDFDQRHDLAPSARLANLDGNLTLTVTVAADSETETPVFGPVTFVLAPQLLITIREHDPKFLKIFAERVQTIANLTVGPIDALLDLLETLVGRAADVLAIISHRIDDKSRVVFGAPRKSARRPKPPEMLSAMLGHIGRLGEFLAQLRAGLFDLERVPPFLQATLAGRLSKPEATRLKSLLRDVQGLTQLSESLSGRCTFLLDATLGLVSIEQNHAMRIYTIVATVLMTPTLIASTYGMNFKHMPELDVPFAYPLALLAMLASAIAPLIWFKRKGWL